MRKRKIWVSVLSAALAMLLMFSLLGSVLPVTAEAWVTKEEVEKAKEEMNKLKDENKELAKEKRREKRKAEAEATEA